MCNIEEFHLRFRGWVLCQSNMTATCAHGYETEIDGSLPDDIPCEHAGQPSPLYAIL